MAVEHTYQQPIVRLIDVDQLAEITDEEADAGEDVGLEGNQQYRDIRSIGWDFVAESLEREKTLFARFAEAVDIDEEADLYAEEIEGAVFPEEDLWGLDIGVISAVMALSALGAVTVSSCNAGGFGGSHVEQFPLVAFFLPRVAAAEVLAIAEVADVGLDMTNAGLARLYGRSDFDLHRFAEVALARQRAREAH